VGSNRRKLEDQRREAAEKEAATRRATDAQVLEDAERLIAAWNERQALRAPMIFSPTIGAAIAALLAYGRLRCRDQTAARRHYQTIAPANNRIHPAHSRHRLPRRHLPDAIRPFYHCRAVNNFTQYPALNSCWPCLGRGSEFRPGPKPFRLSPCQGCMRQRCSTISISK